MSAVLTSSDPALLGPVFPPTVRARDGLALITVQGALPHGHLPMGVVVLVHGLGEHIGRYTRVAAFLNLMGWHVVGYDQRGHGRTQGPRGMLQQEDDLLHDLAAVVDATRAAFPGQRLVILGHSMGGALAARFVSARVPPQEDAAWSRPVDGLVLSAPALAFDMNPIQKALLATVGPLLPNLSVSNGLKPEWICHNPETVRAYKADGMVHNRCSPRLVGFLLQAGQVVRERTARWVTPTLILWGGQDRCVQPQGSAAFAAAAPKEVVSSLVFPTLAHEIFNEREQAAVLSTVSDWLDRVFGG